MDVKSTATNNIVHRVVINRNELIALMECAALEACGIQPGTMGVSFVVGLEDVTEGSPPYKVGVRAVVIVTEDRSK